MAYWGRSNGIVPIDPPEKVIWKGPSSSSSDAQVVRRETAPNIQLLRDWTEMAEFLKRLWCPPENLGCR